MGRTVLQRLLVVLVVNCATCFSTSSILPLIPCYCFLLRHDKLNPDAPEPKQTGSCSAPLYISKQYLLHQHHRGLAKQHDVQQTEFPLSASCTCPVGNGSFIQSASEAPAEAGEEEGRQREDILKKKYQITAFPFRAGGCWPDLHNAENLHHLRV